MMHQLWWLHTLSADFLLQEQPLLVLLVAASLQPPAHVRPLYDSNCQQKCTNPNEQTV
jgi:hypothetical protein